MDDRELTRAAAILEETLSPSQLMRLGKTTGFTKRVRTITPDSLALALITAMASRRINTIADLHRFYVEHTGRNIEYKPLHDQLSKPEFAKFMHAVLTRMLQRLVSRALRPISAGVLNLFNDIILQDGSSHAINDGLAWHWPGRFTATRPAAVELHATMSLFDDQVLSVSLAPDVTGEREFLPKPEELAGKLLLADRGYQDIEYGERLSTAGAFFIVRATTSINPVVRGVVIGGCEQRKGVGQRLKIVRERLKGQNADLTVQWKRKKRLITHRLVLLWNPCTGKHTMLLTNLDSENVEISQVGLLYRLRWQIELLFKEWRSHCNFHRFNTIKIPIVEGLLWASIAAAVLKRFVAYATADVFQLPNISTMRAACSGLFLLTDVLRDITEQRSSRASLGVLLRHLARYAKRARPKRDARTGRARLGLLGAAWPGEQ